MHKELKCKPEKKTNTNKTIYEYTVQFFSNMGIDTISTTKMQNTNLQKTHMNQEKKCNLNHNCEICGANPKRNPL